MHWTGTQWNSSQFPIFMNVNGVHGRAANDVWATGGGRVVHWDGSSWSAVACPGAGTTSTSIWVSPTCDHIWVTAGAGKMLHLHRPAP